jgi:alpha-galactosidase
MNCTIARIGERFALALPQRGMPIIVSAFSHIGYDETGLAQILQRAARINGMDEAVPGAVYLPTGGHGEFGWPAIAGHRHGKAFTFHPAGWRIVEASETKLVLAATDAGAELDIILHFDMNVTLAMRTEITNTGATDYTLDRCMAGTVLVPGNPAAYVGFKGSWGREFHECREPASAKLWIQESRRGRTSHDRYPAVTVESVMGDGTRQVHALHVGWSGNHMLAIDRTDDGRALIHGGELFEPGEIVLKPGETYLSPTVYAAHEAYGDAYDLWPKFHAAVRQDILSWPGGAMRPRPVTLNTWEGIYFDHKPDVLKAHATEAAKLGIERFVLDDGWFGRRDDDTSSLGDWFVDDRKYPQGLGPLVDHVKSLGMEFGIWFEPEMVNRNSDLYRAHPDWILRVEGQPLLESRHQMVLDLTRQEVSDYLFDCLDKVLSDHKISYVKWDMNRDITHAGDAQGHAATSRQTRAVYALMARVRAAHPTVEIETCASGGGRTDYGALKHTHRVWVSDCTDALERLSIQQGALRFLPPEVMGCHISASPNHQTQRRHTLAFRAIVAFFGHLGVELNPLELPDGERVHLKEWITLHKSLRHVLHHPNAEIVNWPVVDGRHVFGVVLDTGSNSDAREEHLVIGVAQGMQTLQEQPRPLALPVYWPESKYTVKLLGPAKPPFIRPHATQLDVLSGNVPIAGGFLSAVGLSMPQMYPESAILLEIKTVKD